MMKKLLLWMCALLLMAQSGCKKVEKLRQITFYMESSYDFTFPVLPITGQLPSLPFTTTTNAVEEFKNNNTTTDLVKEVTLESASLKITNPSTSNFDFLQNIYLYVGSDANDRVLMASLDPVPTGQTTINLNSSGNNVDKYMKSTSLTLSVDSNFRRPLLQPTTMRLTYRFKVIADPLK